MLDELYPTAKQVYALRDVLDEHFGSDETAVLALAEVLAERGKAEVAQKLRQLFDS